ncbi:MAG: hypothetical protein M3Z31_12315 [Pseudomonadota bacterium]|nr:hypothetical protein [Pseudomonadota bacterium]
MNEIVRGLLAAWHGGPLYPADFTRQLSEADAYAIQEAVEAGLAHAAKAGARAWKAGGRDHLTAAPLPRVLASGSEWVPCTEAPLLVEAEVSLRLSKAPSRPDELPACIATMCASIEIVSTRMVNGLQAPAHWKLADHQLHGVSIAGKEIPYVARSWAAQRGRIVISGRATEFAGSHPNGDPAFPLAWLMQHAAARARPLEANDFIMTGSWIVAEAQRGDVVEAHFDDLGSAAVRIGGR